MPFRITLTCSIEPAVAWFIIWSHVCHHSSVTDDCSTNDSRYCYSFIFELDIIGRHFPNIFRVRRFRLRLISYPLLCPCSWFSARRLINWDSMQPWPSPWLLLIKGFTLATSFSLTRNHDITNHVNLLFIMQWICVPISYWYRTSMLRHLSIYYLQLAILL